MANFQVSKWIKFFKEAGIPKEPSTNYAIIFYDNRIQDDMLPDLTKEILRDMGISIMGDVIAILRYAKQVHAQAEREKAAQAFSADKDVGKPKSTAASRMVDHWINNQKSSPGSPSPRSGSPFETKTLSNKKKLTVQASLQDEEPPAKLPARSLSDRFGHSPSATVKMKKKVASNDEGVDPPVSKSVPVKAKKLVSLKPKTTALVTKPKNVKKQSVFDRLGQDPSEQVATSDKLKTGVQPGSNKKEVKALKPLKTSTAYEGQDKAGGSVFSRLGDVQPTATLKKAAVPPAFQQQKPKITIEFDNETVESIDYTSHSVLHPAKKKATPVTKTTKATKPVKQVKPVKRSVGLVADVADGKSVFARLGGKV